jgi:hypothetical protein
MLCGRGMCGLCGAGLGPLCHTTWSLMLPSALPTDTPNHLRVLGDAAHHTNQLMKQYLTGGPLSDSQRLIQIQFICRQQYGDHAGCASAVATCHALEPSLRETWL